MSRESALTSFLVMGTSMLPVMQSGDRAELRPVRRDELQVGDIAVFTNSDGRKVIHRVVRTSPLQTRGDHCRVDDAPVAADSLLYLATGFRRGSEYRKLLNGAAGWREFRRNQRRLKWHMEGRRLLGMILMCNPCKVPFSRATPVVFRERTVYYVGKRPIGWRDAAGWHWMRLARFWVEPPPEENGND